jgi:hypothetical protein
MAPLQWSMNTRQQYYGTPLTGVYPATLKISYQTVAQKLYAGPKQQRFHCYIINQYIKVPYHIL